MKTITLTDEQHETLLQLLYESVGRFVQYSCDLDIEKAKVLKDALDNHLEEKSSTEFNLYDEVWVMHDKPTKMIINEINIRSRTIGHYDTLTIFELKENRKPTIRIGESTMAEYVEAECMFKTKQELIDSL